MAYETEPFHRSLLACFCAHRGTLRIHSGWNCTNCMCYDLWHFREPQNKLEQSEQSKLSFSQINLGLL